MDDGPNPSRSTARATPPTQTVGDVNALHKRPAWNRVIGTIAIVIGSLGLGFYALCTPLGMLLVEVMADLFETAANEPGFNAAGAGAGGGPGGGSAADLKFAADQMRGIADWRGWTIAMGAILAVLGVVLIVGGVRLTRERPTARRTMRIWAVARIVVAIPFAYISYRMQVEQLEAQSQAMGGFGGSGDLSSVAGALGLVFAVIAFAFICAFPVFVLLWLRRPAIRSQMDGWTDETSSNDAA